MSGSVGRWTGDELVNAFVATLAANGRSSYTQRSYALGVAHLLRWLADEAVELETADRRVLAWYVTVSRRGEGAAAQRAPATVNRRVSALAAFSRSSLRAASMARSNCQARCRRPTVRWREPRDAGTRCAAAGGRSCASGCRGACRGGSSQKSRGA